MNSSRSILAGGDGGGGPICGSMARLCGAEEGTAQASEFPTLWKRSSTTGPEVRWTLSLVTLRICISCGCTPSLRRPRVCIGLTVCNESWLIGSGPIAFTESDRDCARELAARESVPAVWNEATDEDI